MANPRLQNLSGLFKNARTRTIIIFTGVVLLFALLIGGAKLLNRPGNENVSAQVGGAPTAMQSIPGGFDKAVSPEYAKLQEQQNAAQGQQAAQTGGTAIPTIIRSSSFGGQGNCSQCCNCQGAGVAANGGIPVGQSSSLAPGTLVYDANGKVIGTLGPDGKVRNANGIVVGTVGPDGLVRDANGNVIGSAGAAAAGTPVYDENGNVIGTIGPDGKVRDANGNVIGTVGPDGVVRDANGAVIGKAGSAVVGTPVYDANGNLLGTVGADGKVRDANGKIVGTVGPDGVVRDANGKIIGKASATGGNLHPVYDAQGKLIGMAGPDGIVRDANGKIIGTVGADGSVRDTTGKVIGHVANVVPGTPVYDSQGRLIGTVGADGKVRDANGNVIGTVGADGIVRDANGNIIGKAGPTKAGTPVYDSQGHLIGMVGADGKVRDVNGKIIGTVGVDGVVRDANGNVIGSTTVPGTAAVGAGAASTTPSTIPTIGGANPQMQAVLQRQAALYSSQKAEQLKAQTMGLMSAQASQLFSAWVSPVQQNVAGNPPATSGPSVNGPGGYAGSAAAAAALAGQGPPEMKAGSIAYAVLVTAINSDEPGPVIATIVSGKFSGARLLGTLTNQGKAVLLTFTTMSLPNVPSSVTINAVAVDEKTARTAFSSYTDNHYLLRYGSLFAASFLQGYAQALTTSGTTITSTGLATNTTTPNLSPNSKYMVALGNVGSRYSSMATNVFDTPPTVYVNSGTAMGILFLSDVPAFKM